jgi:hypothetical protein
MQTKEHRYDKAPLTIPYQQAYWNRLERLSNYPVLPSQRGNKS